MSLLALLTPGPAEHEAVLLGLENEGAFQWQIEAKIEALQAAYARLRAEAAKEGG